ncbi:MAG TPA: hypothetical protein VFM02_00360 [Candidatus Paceibacterota bacterium]|nr:hypothetical protein [Candidatus Paceibacterota bacterium]
MTNTTNAKPKRTIKEDGELVSLLSFIENNVSKENFIAWLNTQENKSYSDEDTWERIKTELTGGEGVDLNDLRTYAKSLGSEQDVENLLREVRKSTQHAERTVERLSYLSYFKKFSVAVGGATIFVGLLFLLLSGSLAFHLLGNTLSSDIRVGTLSVSIFVGLLNILAGLLLATR